MRRRTPVVFPTNTIDIGVIDDTPIAHLIPYYPQPYFRSPTARGSGTFRQALDDENQQPRHSGWPWRRWFRHLIFGQLDFLPGAGPLWFGFLRPQSECYGDRRGEHDAGQSASGDLGRLKWLRSQGRRHR